MTNPLDPTALDALEHDLTTVDGELAELTRSTIRALRAECERLRAETLCDVCAGTGKPVSGKRCACGGSGKAFDAAAYFRVALLDANAQIERLREAEAEQSNALADIASR